MKKLHPLCVSILIAVLTFVTVENVAQCMPDTVTYKSPGIWPDSTMNIPPACVGEPYQTVVTAIVPPDTVFFGYTWQINWLQVVDVVGLPPGFSYLCSFPSCQIPGDTTGCVLIQGTAQAGMGGTYNITVFSAAQAYNSIFGTQTVYDTLENFYRLVVGEPSVNLQDAQICAGSSLTLDAANPGATYQWSTAETTQTISVNTAGDYSVTVTDGAGCTDSDTATITVGAALGVDLGADGVLCQGNSIQLNAGFPGSTYLWSTGATTQTLTVNSAGTYSVTVTDANGCTGTDATIWTVVPLPNANAGADTDICPGDTATLTASGGINYNWGSAGTGITVEVTPTATTTYTVTVTDANNCADTDNVTVTVNTLPTVNIGNSITQCDSVTLDAGNAGAQYEWSTGATTQQLTVFSSGTYGVTVTNGNGCVGSDDVNVTVTVCPGIHETDFGHLISVYPNPAEGLFYVELPQLSASTFDIRIMSIHGQLVQGLTLNSGSKAVLDLVDSPSGIYYLKMTSGDRQAVKMLIKE